MFDNYNTPPSFSEFSAKLAPSNLSQTSESLYLFHGTSCLRRMEIKRSGKILGGRGDLTFFSNSPIEALNYAKISCLRDSLNHINTNSLAMEPIVLKVKFDNNLWDAVSFVEPNLRDDKFMATIAVIGSISTEYIEDILFCKHLRKDNPDYQKHIINLAQIKRLRKLIIQRAIYLLILNFLYNLSLKIKYKINDLNRKSFNNSLTLSELRHR